MSDTAAAVIEPVKKVAFMSRPYSKEERIKKEEDELEELIKEQKADSDSDTQIFVDINKNKQKIYDLKLIV